jgi:hypothetical protein
MTIYKEDKKGRPKGVLHIFSDKNLDPDLERLGNFFIKRMPEGEISFEAFIGNPAHAWSIYGRSAKSLEKALMAG